MNKNLELVRSTDDQEVLWSFRYDQVPVVQQTALGRITDPEKLAEIQRVKDSIMDGETPPFDKSTTEKFLKQLDRAVVRALTVTNLHLNEDGRPALTEAFTVELLGGIAYVRMLVEGRIVGSGKTIDSLIADGHAGITVIGFGGDAEASTLWGNFGDNIMEVAAGRVANNVAMENTGLAIEEPSGWKNVVDRWYDPAPEVKEDEV